MICHNKQYKDHKSVVKDFQYYAPEVVKVLKYEVQVKVPSKTL